MKEVLNMKLFVIKIAKYNQSSILTSIKILNHYNCTNCQKATEEGSGYWLMNNSLETIKVYQR
jgi:hypothetical protein